MALKEFFNSIVTGSQKVKAAQTADNATKATSATSASAVPWSGVTGKPSSFTPSSHNHDDRYFTEAEINSKITAINKRIPTYLSIDIDKSTLDRYLVVHDSGIGGGTFKVKLELS